MTHIFISTSHIFSLEIQYNVFFLIKINKNVFYLIKLVTGVVMSNLMTMPALGIRTESRVVQPTTLRLKQVVRNFLGLSANLIEII